jgi:hypothetical protein
MVMSRILIPPLIISWFAGLHDTPAIRILARSDSIIEVMIAFFQGACLQSRWEEMNDRS